MKLKDGVMLTYLDFDTDYCLLSVRNVQILFDYFQNLDAHKKNTLNDVQFYHFMRHVSDLGKEQIMMTFDLLDWSASGEISFEAFHLLACILLCCEYRVEREFMHHHSAHIFELLDTQGSGSIRRAELQAFGFLFNVTGNVLYRIIDELDIPEILYYKEYKIFVMACAEMKAEANKMRNKKTEHERSKQHECQPPRHLT